jgi:hypothetical protein
MPTDAPTTLCSVESFLEGAFADLARGYSTTAINNIIIEATRACESSTDRRLVPFTITETQRADGLDVEDALDAYVPLDPTSQLGFSRAQSLGSTLLVRHFWVSEVPTRYPELWTGAINSIQLLRSFSGTQAVDIGTLQYEPDTGHVRFQLGSFVPPGTTIVVNYSGGYSTIPADLARACKFFAASLILKELDPAQAVHGHDPDALRLDAMELLASYTRK